MNTTDHHLLVKLAFDSFPEKLKKDWNEFLSEAQSVCMYPDTYAVQLQTGETGKWREYFCSGKKNGPGKQKQAFIEKFIPPIEFYTKNCIDNIREGDMREAARFIGVFSHLLGDFAQPAHWYESEIFELMPPPPHLNNCNIHSLIEGTCSSLRKIEYSPRVIATSQKELVFLIKSSFAKLRRKTVSVIVPMLRNLYSGKVDKARECYNPVMAEATALLADFCVTTHTLALKKINKQDMRKSAVCDLLEIIPSAYDVEKVYGARPITDSFVPSSGVVRLVKLNLNCKESIREIKCICPVPYAMPSDKRPFWSWMEYHIPKGVYSIFESSIGLCAGVKPQAECIFEVHCDGKNVFRSGVFNAGDPAENIHVDIGKCSKVKLIVYTDGSTDKLAYPIWGNPVFLKKV